MNMLLYDRNRKVKKQFQKNISKFIRRIVIVCLLLLQDDKRMQNDHLQDKEKEASHWMFY
jgi:hypothetical protein